MQQAWGQRYSHTRPETDPQEVLASTRLESRTSEWVVSHPIPTPNRVSALATVVANIDRI